MKERLFYLILISILSLSMSKLLPHFIYDGIESFRECLEEKDIISFSIYGTLTEDLDLSNMKADNYDIKEMGTFQCSLQTNENKKNKNRKHKIYCQIEGLYERKAFILDEPKVTGFDFNNENGESSWPKIPERKMFLIGKCGKKVELNDEPILMGNTDGYSNPFDTVREGIVDQALSSLPERTSVDLIGMFSAMKSARSIYSLSEAESAYLVFKWLHENIAYDCYAFHHGGIDYSEKGTYEKGKGVCAGYSFLYEDMCIAMGLEVEYVVGYAGFSAGVVPTTTDHAWNAVKIDSKYYLVDSTWGAGSCNGDPFAQELKTFYFCTDPEKFIHSHIPAESQWQLLNPALTLEQVVNLADLTNYFYTQGFLTISPNKYSISSAKSFTITITHTQVTSDMSFLGSLYYTEGGSYQRQSYACIDKVNNNVIQITCLTNYIGKYSLQIYGGKSDEKGMIKLIAQYEIESTEAVSPPVQFPTIYYSLSEFQIIEPLYAPLIIGSTYNFKFITNLFDNLYIKDENYIQLDKNGNEFSKKSVTIKKQLRLYTKNGSSYSLIGEYATTN